MERYILQTGEQPGTWACTDTQLGIVCRWADGRFNDTRKQRYCPIPLRGGGMVTLYANAMREMADWLLANHKEKVWQ
jgi:hypothetical protein